MDKDSHGGVGGSLGGLESRASSPVISLSPSQSHFLSVVRRDIYKIFIGLLIVGVYLGGIWYLFVKSTYLVWLSELIARISGLVS